MDREQYFEAVQDAIEALHIMMKLRPEMTWHYGPICGALEWELDNECVALEVEIFMNGGSNAQA